MVDYKKYIQVVGILDSFIEWTDDPYPNIESKASAICELFDKKEAQSIGYFGYVKPMTLWDHLQNAPTPIPCITPKTFPLDLNRVTCECTDKTDCEWYN